MDIQEIRGRIEEQLRQYYEFFVQENCGGRITAIHQDREMAPEILTELYNLICAIGGLDNATAKEEELEELNTEDDEEPEGFPQDEEPNEYRYIDPAWIDAVATGLTAGAKKHPGESWKTIPAKEHAARAIRHLFLFCKGDQSDDHLTNASMRCMMASVLAMAAQERRQRKNE